MKGQKIISPLFKIMDLSTIAEKLNLSVATIEKESLKNFLERKLLETRAELFSLANKYGVKSLREFDHLIKTGKIHEAPESREDFFKLDYLETRLQTIEKLLKSL